MIRVILNGQPTDLEAGLSVATLLEQRFGSFQAVFAVAAAIYFAGGLLWLKIDPARPLT